MRTVAPIALIVSVIASNAAYGQISGVSGTIAHGDTITISGASFGNKTTAAPWKFDSFESGADQSELSGWSFDTGGGTANPEYSDNYTRTNSDMSAVSIFADGQYLSTFGVYEAGGATSIYIDFWVLFDRADPESRNHKLFRFYSGQNSGLPNFYFQMYCDEASSEGHFTNDGVSGDDYGDTRAYPGWTNGNADGNWVHFQVYTEQSSAGVGDGVLKSWIDCGNTVDRSDFWSRDVTNDTDWHSVWFGNYNGHGAQEPCSASGDAYIYFDDVYVDTTRARVEVGNAASYASCTHREIQIPVSWSATEIQAALNLGTFTADSTAYLFVVDEDGSASSGYQVTIGGAETALAISTATADGTTVTVTWNDDGSDSWELLAADQGDAIFHYAGTDTTIEFPYAASDAIDVRVRGVTSGTAGAWVKTGIAAQ